MEEAIKISKEKMEGTVKVAESEKEEISKMIAVGAIKYSVLRQETTKDIVFDFDKSVSFEGNSGPYIQYTLARASSLLRKAEEEKIKPSSDNALNAGNSTIERILYRYPEIVARAGAQYSPHYIATYLFETAQAFNFYYTEHRIVDANDTKSPYKVLLTKAVTEILRNGLTILGIPAPEKM